MDQNDDFTTNPDGSENSEMRLSGYPENLKNDYDLAGKTYFDLCDAYLNGSRNIVSIGDAISREELLSSANADFASLKPANYSVPTSSRLFYLLDETPGKLSEVLTQSNLNWRAQISVANFVSSLQWYRGQKSDYATVYQFIISYEDSILADPLLTAGEKKTILTVSSVARYMFYFAKKEKDKEPKRRDRDWDLSIGNFTAAIDGANNSTASGVSVPTAAALYLNR